MFVFDVETLGKQSNSVILSFACIYFNPDDQPSHTELKQSAFFAKLNAADQMQRLKRTAGKSTMEWWSKQCENVKNKSFKPTHKIILKDDYVTREEAYADEIILQKYYKVVENPHFANRAYQTSTKFCLKGEERIEVSSRAGKIGGKKAYDSKLGIHALTSKEKSEAGKKSYQSGKNFVASMSKEERSAHSKKIYEQGIGIASLTKEEQIEIGNKTYEMKVGIHGLTPEERSKNGKKGGERVKELGIGIFAMTMEEKIEIGKRSAENMNSQKWMCLETGYISSPGNLAKYQKRNNIDTSKRKRVS